jgi:hypothetical protein
VVVVVVHCYLHLGGTNAESGSLKR